MRKGFVFLAIFLFPALAFSADEAVAKIKSALKDLPVEWVKPFDPIPGLYEVKAGRNLYYVDATGRYLISGHVFETATHRDLTARRLEEINRIDWSILPLDAAIVSGDPNGLKLAVFTDPDCPYCRKLEQELKGIQGLRIYTFLYPIPALHPDATRKARAIWCAEDRHRALQEVMLNGKDPGQASCDAPLDQIAAVARKIGVMGTPTLVSGDGRVHSGWMTRRQLLQWLDKDRRNHAEKP